MGTIADSIRGLAESVHLASMGFVTAIEVDQRAFDSLLGDIGRSVSVEDLRFARPGGSSEPTRISSVVMYTDAGQVTIRPGAGG